MLFDSLIKYFETHTKESLPAIGWREKRVRAYIDIDKNGKLHSIVAAPDKAGWLLHIPDYKGGTSNDDAHLLCHGTEYLFAHVKPSKTKSKPPTKALLNKAETRFLMSAEEHHKYLDDLDCEAARAVCRFFDNWDPSAITDEELQAVPDTDFVFHLYDPETHTSTPILDDPLIRARITEKGYQDLAQGKLCVSCVTGRKAPLARLHPALPKLVGNSACLTHLVSFNKDAHDSFGCKNGENFPITKYEAFAYTTALRHLLSDPAHRSIMGDTTVIWWADKKDEEASACVASLLTAGFGMQAQAESTDTEDAVTERIKATVAAIRAGHLPRALKADIPFHILGLTPNSGRIVITFYEENNFDEVIEKLERHYARTKLAHAPFLSDLTSPYRFIIAAQRTYAKSKGNTDKKGAAKKDKAAKPDTTTRQLFTALMESILADAPYPETLAQRILSRIRREGVKDTRLTYERTQFLKAYLIKNKGKDIPVALDRQCDNVAYLIGRYLAVVAKLQQDTLTKEQRDTMTTTAERNLNAVLARPATAMITVVRKAQIYLEKLRPEHRSWEINYRKELNEIMDKMPIELPSTLSGPEQMTAMVGYANQETANYQRLHKTPANDDPTDPESGVIALDDAAAEENAA